MIKFLRSLAIVLTVLVVSVVMVVSTAASAGPERSSTPAAAELAGSGEIGPASYCYPPQLWSPGLGFVDCQLFERYDVTLECSGGVSYPLGIYEPGFWRFDIFCDPLAFVTIVGVPV
jgi:hypothetical protein